MNRDNDIRRAFQAKFDGYQPPLAADGWEHIEHSLNQAGAYRSVIRRRWYAGTAAALLLLLVGSIFFLRDPMTVPETMVTESNSPQPESRYAPEQPATAESTVAEVQQTFVSPTRASARLTFAGRSQRDELLVGRNSSAAMLTRWMEQEGIGANRQLTGNWTSLRSLLRRSAVERAGQIDTKGEELITVSGNDDQLFAEYAGYSSGDEPLIVGLSGKGGLSSFKQSVNTPMTLRSASIPTDNHYAEGGKQMLAGTLASDNFSEMEHDQPLSFGLTLSKQISDKLSVESGLTYSYLSSRVRNANANFRVEETQKIHYLGIPLNLNYTLFTFNNFNIYASLGGMLEKDIYGEYRKLGVGESADFNSTAQEEEVTKISQRNPQLSVNAGVGISYPLIQNLRVYGKAGGAYYFDAGNQYKTIYSDRKIVMDLNIGFRYEF
ncbi:outer membrane beta-barrel protein [Dysgonomonadaceae bacterium zrk40]|nr:outer membrane beta-barrel protein [Dysgonomonadaceae bacterium zrk40]